MPSRFFSSRGIPFAALLLAAATLACADRGAEQRADDDSALARDLALVQAATSVQPSFRDTALTLSPAPRVTLPSSDSRPPATRAVAPSRRQPPRAQSAPRSRPQVAVLPQPERPEQPAPEPAPTTETSGDRGRIIGAGSVLTATTNGRVCTRSNSPGDRITATVTAPVHGINGAEIPSGATVVLEVASINGGASSSDAEIVFRVRAVDVDEESHPATGSARATGSLERIQPPGNAAADKKKVIGGAIAGAILGQMMGKDTRSTIIGAAAGAAAGTAAAKMGNGAADDCLAVGAPMRIVLDDALVLR